MRPAFDALFEVDNAMGEVVRSTTEPALGAIRLAWWREALERLDHAPPPAEPRLEGVTRELQPRGVSGAALAGVEDGWTEMLREVPWDGDVVEAIATRGRRLFAIGAALVGADAGEASDAGAIFALAQAVRTAPDRDTAVLLVDRGLGLRPSPVARRLRPLTALAALARRDLIAFPRREAEGTPGRALTLLKHRITGRV